MSVLQVENSAEAQKFSEECTAKRKKKRKKKKKKTTEKKRKKNLMFSCSNKWRRAFVFCTGSTGSVEHAMELLSSHWCDRIFTRKVQDAKLRYQHEENLLACPRQLCVHVWHKGNISIRTRIVPLMLSRQKCEKKFIQWSFCVHQVKERYGPNLDKLHSGHVVGIMVDDDSNLHLYVNGVDQGKHVATENFLVGTSCCKLCKWMWKCLSLLSCRSGGQRNFFTVLRLGRSLWSVWKSNGCDGRQWTECPATRLQRKSWPGRQ